MRATAVPAVLLAILLASPPVASGQVGVGIRAGTVGLGADIALTMSPNIQLRGGAAIQPWNPTFTISDIEYTVNLPGSFINVGLDFFPTGGGFRIGGGVLFKPDDTSISGVFAGSVDIGGQSYTGSQVGTLTGTVTSKSAAPYAMIGFGKHASSGIGLFLDLGATFVGERTDRRRRPISGEPRCGAVGHGGFAEQAQDLSDGEPGSTDRRWRLS